MNTQLKALEIADALKQRVERLHSVNAELVKVLKLLHLDLTQPTGLQTTSAELVEQAPAALTKATGKLYETRADIRRQRPSAAHRPL